MAKRYFNIFKSHIAMLILIVTLICVSEVTTGTVSLVAKLITGVLLIYSAISYVIWLIKAPTVQIPEENL
jgi:hypothetical protein